MALLATQTARKEPGRRRVSATEMFDRGCLSTTYPFRCEPSDVHPATQASPEQEGASSGVSEAPKDTTEFLHIHKPDYDNHAQYQKTRR